MKPNEQAIGIFDSGLGGLTILRAVKKLMPKENIIYFGDTAHSPYGSKSKETVAEYSLNIAKFLESKKVKLILVACNTASALALPVLKRHIKAPVLGVIEPGAACAAKAAANKKVTVLGTEATVKSKEYIKNIKKLDKSIAVTQYACPLFVPIIEEGLAGSDICKLAIKRYLTPLKTDKADTVILGCTHYPVIKEDIAKFLGPKVTLVDSAEEIAKRAKDALLRAGLLKTGGKSSTQIYASDLSERFSRLALNIIGGKKLKVKENRFYI